MRNGGGLPCLGNGDRQPGAKSKASTSFADGSGGVAIVEADSAATLARTTAPWTTSLSFTVTPILETVTLPSRPPTRAEIAQLVERIPLLLTYSDARPTASTGKRRGSRFVLRC